MDMNTHMDVRAHTHTHTHTLIYLHTNKIGRKFIVHQQQMFEKM